MKNIRNSIFAVSALIAGSMLFASCGENPDSVQVDATPSITESTAAPDESAKKEASAADITAAVMAEIEIQSAIEKNIDEVGAFYDVDTAAVEDMSVYICGSGAYPDELAVFRFTDSAAAETGAEAVRKRLDSQTALYRDYTPDEVYKLDDAALIQKDNWVILTICSDNSRAEEIIDGLL